MRLRMRSKAYRDAKDAQAPDAPPSDQLTAAGKGWQDALKAYKDAEAAFAAEQDKPLTVTTPTTQLRAASAQLAKATHDRVKTHATAPAGGIVSNVTLRPGATVQAGTPLFAIIEANRWWVDANFKETDLARIKVGQPATVYLDMYPGVTFDGVVESISAGSGADLLGAAAGERDRQLGEGDAALSRAHQPDQPAGRQAAPGGRQRLGDDRHDPGQKMSRRKPGAKKPRAQRPKEVTPPEPPRQAEASAPPPEPPSSSRNCRSLPSRRIASTSRRSPSSSPSCSRRSSKCSTSPS